MSNLRVRRRNRHVKSGQIVVFKPFASMYQLEQPPEFHTVGGSRR